MIRILRLVALVAVLFTVAPLADASLSSGLPSGPVGTPAMSTTDYVNRSDVMLVGDSISVRGYRDLAAALPGRRLAVNAWSGRNTTLSVDSLFAQLKAGVTLPPVLIMAVGSNDIFAAGGMAAQVRRLLAGVPATTRVYWVDVSVLRPAYRFADRVNSGHVNDAIRANCVGNCSVISWAGFLSVGSRRARLIDRGGVHPIGGVGTKAWAALISGSIR